MNSHISSVPDLKATDQCFDAVGETTGRVRVMGLN